MDLSPVHAGTLMGITNFCANIMSIMGPLFVGAVVTDSVSMKNATIYVIYIDTSLFAFYISVWSYFVEAGVFYGSRLLFDWEYVVHHLWPRLNPTLELR